MPQRKRYEMQTSHGQYSSDHLYFCDGFYVTGDAIT